MAIALVAHVAIAAGTGTTTAAINTTGSSLLAIFLSGANTQNAPVDSKGNTWIGLTQQTGQFSSQAGWFYALTPTVGSGHTFTMGQGGNLVQGMCVLAFSGVSAHDADTGSSNIGSSGTAQDGSLTPA